MLRPNAQLKKKKGLCWIRIGDIGRNRLIAEHEICFTMTDV